MKKDAKEIQGIRAEDGDADSYCVDGQYSEYEKAEGEATEEPVANKIWAHLVKEAKRDSAVLSAISLHYAVANFAKLNDISPAMQDEMEAAIREGAEKEGQDADLRVEYFFAGSNGTV